ncbi:hypothetical protein QEN19_001562 [Hanseniaspora menglaensis]
MVEDQPQTGYSSITSGRRDIEGEPMFSSEFTAPKGFLESILFQFNRLKYVLIYTLILVYGISLLFAIINKLTIPSETAKHKKILTFNESVNPANGLKKVSFDVVRSGDLKPNYKPLQWLSVVDGPSEDKGLYSTMDDNKYLIKSVLDTEYEQLLFDGKNFTFEGSEFKIDDFKSSPDLKFALLRTNSKRLWRHSYHADYYILNVSTQKIDLLVKNLTMVAFSPDSQKIAYVLNNDLYVFDIFKNSTQRVTESGSENVFNGKADWVYEEEILESDQAVWWSPSSDHITFLKIDETKVDEFSINYYVQQDAGKQIPSYPDLKTIKYPKSGTPNPIVDIKVFSLKSKDTVTYKLDEPTQLINEIVYLGDKKFIAKVTDRTATYLKVFVMDVDGSEKTLQRLQFDEEEWIELTHYTTHVPALKTNEGADGYIDVIPIDGFNHLVYYPNLSSDNHIQLTSGDWEVVNGVTSFDKQKRIVWFISTKKSSIERHLYYVSLDEPLKIHEVTDVSSDGYYAASFSSGSRFALLNYMGPNIPYQKVLDFKNQDEAKTLYYLEENKKLKENLPLYDIPEKKFKKINIGPDANGADIVLNSFEILPNNFNPKLKNHYPVFFFGYNGPNSQQVNKIFSIGLNQVIASQLNAIFVCVDTRGTGFLGKKHRSLVRDNLGQHESDDFIKVAKHYSAKSYVDSEKTLIYGWSYGGFMSLFTLQKDQGETFKYAISVAPVTNWLLYDSVYTERYMSLPEKNSAGYKNSSINNVENIFKAQRVLLMHGLGDDNVHFQNAANLIDQAVVKKVKNFDVKVFPDSDHSISYHGAYDIVMDQLISWAGQAFNGDFEGRWEY